MRRRTGKHGTANRQFQLTHPTRGATAISAAKDAALAISTHTPHTGCDRCAREAQAYRVEFQLTHPTRGATRRDKPLFWY